MVIFASSESSRRATKLHEKGHFARDIEKRGHVPPMPPPIPTSMVIMQEIEHPVGHTAKHLSPNEIVQAHRCM